MAISNIWKIHSVVIKKDPNQATPLHADHDYISAITTASMPVNADVTRTVTTNDTFATTGFINFRSVDVQFTSTMAKAVLDAIGVGLGLCFSPGGSELDVYAAQYGCNGPLAGSVHRRYTMTKGVLNLANLTCEHQGDLQVSAQIQSVYDGTNDPVTITDSVSLPTDVLIGDRTEAWTLSVPADTLVLSNAVGQKTSVNVDFGVSTSTRGADSEVFDSYVAIDSILPVVTCTGVNPEWLGLTADNIGLTINGNPVAHADTKFVFRKRDGAGGFVSDVTAEHIYMTANGPAFFDNVLSSSGTEAATTSFRIEPTEDSSGNAPLVFNTATAI